MPVDVTLNGEQTAVHDGASLADIVDSDNDSEACEGIAIARNGAVVPRGEWKTTPVEPGDEIEIVRAVQGG